VYVYTILVYIYTHTHTQTQTHLKNRLLVSVGKCFVQGVYHGLIFMRGMGAQVKNTVSSRKDFRPHTSDRAPINGALRKDSRP